MTCTIKKMAVWFPNHKSKSHLILYSLQLFPSKYRLLLELHLHQTSLKRHHSPLQPPILHSHKTPSPPQENDDEEEAVIKEVLVLSETPKPHENQHGKITQTPPPLPPPPKTETQVSHPVKQQQQQQEQEEETSHISQRSEIYSVSETITTTTTTTAAECLREDEATSKDNSQLKHKSPAKAIKKRPTNGDPPGVRARRESTRGPGRRSSAARTVQRNVGSRSRSPGTGRIGGVRNGAVGKSPATVTGKTYKKTTSSGGATVEGQSKREEDGKNDVLEQQQQVTESIENDSYFYESFCLKKPAKAFFCRAVFPQSVV